MLIILTVLRFENFFFKISSTRFLLLTKLFGKVIWNTKGDCFSNKKGQYFLDSNFYTRHVYFQNMNLFQINNVPSITLLSEYYFEGNFTI